MKNKINKIIGALPKVQEANRKLTQLRGLAEDELFTGKSSEVVGSWWEICGRGNRKGTGMSPYRKVLAHMLIFDGIVNFFSTK